MDAVKGEGGEITLCAKKQNGNILIAVKDSGQGIAPEVMDRLFHSMVTTKGAMGTGLGLYSSAGLIRGKFSGRMWAENRPEGGAAFYVELPCKVKRKRLFEVKVCEKQGRTAEKRLHHAGSG